MRKKEKEGVIRFRMEVSCCPNPGYGPDRCTLTLNEADAKRLHANIKFVADNEKRADMTRDEIDSVDFMCAAEFSISGAEEMFQEQGIRLCCFTDMFCVSFYDDDGADQYESETVALETLEKRMKRKGWL